MLLVVVLAAIGLVSCANAGGGSGSDGGSGTDKIQGWWKYFAESNGVSLTTYIEYDKDGNVLRAGTDREYTGQFLETYQINMTYEKLKNLNNFSKITDESELPSWAKENDGDINTNEPLSPAKQLEKDLLEWGSGTAIVDDETYKLSFDVYSQYYTAITVAIQDSTLSGGWANVRTECNVIEKNGKFYLEQESDKRQITAITLIDISKWFIFIYFINR